MTSPFCDTLRYCSPSHGGWGIVRTAMLVPESYQLFVCPFACGRHGALGAMVQNLKDRLSYLCIDETDIVSGGYEDLIPCAVDDLLEQVHRRPRALFVVVSCLDDLLCTDHEVFLAEIRRRHPDLKVALGHMNPISMDGTLPPAVNIQRSMYSFLEPQGDPLPGTAALYGNNVALDPEGELFSALSLGGYSEVRHISECQGYDSFARFARMSLNVVPTPVGLPAARDVQKKLGIPWVFMPISYDYDEIDGYYEDLLAPRGEAMDTSLLRVRASEALSRAADEVGNLSVIVDGSATIRPFSLAELLLRHGFSVKTVYAQKCIPLERPAFNRLRENYPRVEVLQPEHPRGPLIRKTDWPGLAVGFEGAYLTGAIHVVNLMNDETLYGYHGITKLASMIRQALREPTDLQAFIQAYGIVV